MEPALSTDQSTIAAGVRVVIFDLDGTLYQGEAFVPRYLELIGQHTGIDVEVARVELDAILAGEHPVPLGVFYDPDVDRVLHAPAWRIVGAADWHGEPVDDPRIGRNVGYRDGLIYLGDAWQVVRVVAAHLGAPADGVKAAFHAVREAINTASDQLLDTSALASVLAELHRFEHRLLMTNTPEALGRALVDALGLAEHFDGVRFGARKPAGLEQWLDELTAELAVDADQILCVGDNYFNDVLPAVRSGCRAIWLDPYGQAPHEGPEVAVRGLADVAALLRAAGG